GGAEMDLGVGGVLELLEQKEPLGVAGYHLFGPDDGAGHAFGAGGENQVGAQSLEHLAALRRHGLGHGEVDGIPAGGGNEGQRDPGVAAGGLHQLPAGTQRTALFSVPNHGGADPALHAVGGVASFDFCQNGGFAAIRDAAQANQRGLPDAERIIVVDSHG